MPELEIPKSFRKRLDKKPARLKFAILECVHRLGTDPHHPGLKTHKIQGKEGIFEAYVDKSNRVTWEYGENRIVLRNHCTHDIIERNP